MSGSRKSRGEKICDPREVSATDLLIDVQLFKSGWQTGLARPPSISVRSTHVPLQRPGVVSLNVEGLRPAIRSFLFSPAALPLPTAAESEGHKASPPPAI